MTKEEQDKLASGTIGGGLGFLLGWLLRPKPVGAECPPYTLYVEYIEHQGSIGWPGGEVPINVVIENRADYAQQAEVCLQVGNHILHQEVWLQPGWNTVTFTYYVDVPLGTYLTLNMTAAIAAANSVLNAGGGG